MYTHNLLLEREWRRKNEQFLENSFVEFHPSYLWDDVCMKLIERINLILLLGECVHEGCDDKIVKRVDEWFVGHSIKCFPLCIIIIIIHADWQTYSMQFNMCTTFPHFWTNVIGYRNWKKDLNHLHVSVQVLSNSNWVPLFRATWDLS